MFSWETVRICIRIYDLRFTNLRLGLEAIANRKSQIQNRKSEGFYNHQRLAILDRLAVLDQNARDAAADLGFDLIHHFHGLDDADTVAGLDGIALLNIRWILGRWRPIKG